MHAIVVTGKASIKDCDELRFENMAVSVINELIKKFNFKRWNILKRWNTYKLISGSSKKIKADLEKVFIEKQKQDILLIYIGHGQENGWALSGIRDIDSLNYEELSLILAHHEGRLIFLNCCCFAGAAKWPLASHFGEHLLIAAMPEYKFGYVNNFFQYIFEDWSAHRLYNPHMSYDNFDSIPQVEGNEELQRLFFVNNLKIWEIMKKMIMKLFSQ